MSRQEEHTEIQPGVIEDPLSLFSDVSSWFSSLLSRPCLLRSQLDRQVYNRLIFKIDFTVTRALKSQASPKITFFFKRVLALLFSKHSVSSKRTALVHNAAFVKSLLACCIETYFFVHGQTALSFEEVLSALNLDPFDFWKQINNFANFDSEIPVPLLEYLKEVENKVLVSLVWRSKSLLYKMKTEPSFPMFSRRLLALVNSRIVLFSSQIGLNNTIQTLVWEAAKHFLSEYTESMRDVSMDQLLMSIIFAVCKVKCEIPFINIIAKYHETFHCQSNIDEEYEELNLFYNNCLIPRMKDFILGSLPMTPPRIAQLNPQIELNYDVQDKAHSEYMTPRTKKLWDYGMENYRPSRRRLEFESYSHS